MNATVNEHVTDQVTNETPTMKDLIVASSGRDEENGFPNASCNLYLDIYHTDGTEPESIGQLAMVSPTVEIFRHADTSMVTLQFPTKFDGELSSAYNMLESFAEAKNSMADDIKDIPMVRLVVIPAKWDGRYYILASNPLMWTLCPTGLDGEPNALRFAFADEDICAYDGGEEADELADALGAEDDNESFETHIDDVVSNENSEDKTE